MKKVVVLLATYNGEKYIRAQIQSILNQELPNNWTLNILVADDGSTDRTSSIINELALSEPCITILPTRNQTKEGPSKTFFHLLKSIEPNTANLFSFSDQDDIWLQGKIKTVIYAIGLDQELGIYLGSAYLVKDELQIISRIPQVGVRTQFPSILLSNQRAGMTIAITEELRQEVLKSQTDSALMHDWWIQLVALSSGAKILEDDQAFVLYRQHDSNALGIPQSFLSRIKFFKTKGNDLFKRRSEQAKEFANYSQDPELIKQAELVSNLIARGPKSFLSCIKIISTKRFFMNRSRHGMHFHKFMLFLSFIRYHLKVRYLQ